jgi:hypothetical protein
MFIGTFGHRACCAAGKQHALYTLDLCYCKLQYGSKNLPFVRPYPTSGQHYIDCALPQVYNAFIIIVPCKR